jgi:hypothetical protein
LTRCKSKRLIEGFVSNGLFGRFSAQFPPQNVTIIGVHDFAYISETTLCQNSSRGGVVPLRVGADNANSSTIESERRQRFHGLRRKAAASLSSVNAVGHLDSSIRVWRPLETTTPDDRSAGPHSICEAERPWVAFRRLSNASQPIGRHLRTIDRGHHLDEREQLGWRLQNQFEASNRNRNQVNVLPFQRPNTSVHQATGRTPITKIREATVALVERIVMHCTGSRRESLKSRQRIGAHFVLFGDIVFQFENRIKQDFLHCPIVDQASSEN